MTNPNSTTPPSAGEQNLRGAELSGSEQKTAADHLEYQRKRNPDTTLRVDGESDTLYSDGLEIDQDAGSLAETRGADHHT